MMHTKIVEIDGWDIGLTGTELWNMYCFGINEAKRDELFVRKVIGSGGKMTVVEFVWRD